MLILKRVVLTALAGAALVSAQAMAQAISFENTDARNVKFPNMDKAWLKGGAIMDPMHPRSMGLGLTKNQVRSIISYPHFNENMFGEREWNYIFNFKKPDGGYLVCQYQVQFDEHVRTKGLYWDREECMRFVNNDRPRPVASAPAPAPQAIVLSADGLFEFGKSSLADLLPEGHQKLQALAQGVRNGYKLSGVEVVGYTDRIGSASSNLALSFARAQTVKRFLAQSGIPAELITVRGLGAANPLVNCAGPKSAAVIACLKPNRRVELLISGTKG